MGWPKNYTSRNVTFWHAEARPVSAEPGVDAATRSRFNWGRGTKQHYCHQKSCHPLYWTHPHPPSYMSFEATCSFLAFFCSSPCSTRSSVLWPLGRFEIAYSSASCFHTSCQK